MAMDFLNPAHESASQQANGPLLAWADRARPLAGSRGPGRTSPSQTDWAYWLDKVRWVFGYGSLIWNPDMPVRRGVPGRVDGYHRRFCISSTRYRGSPEQPGVVLGLDRGGSCQGMAWELLPGREADALDKLWLREMINGAYRPRLLRVRLKDGGRLNALSFIARREHPGYLRLNDDELLRRLAACQGDRGSNRDYLSHTVHALQDHGIADLHLCRLLDRLSRL
ncbi:MAG: gamma-glutamylcyclotransferase [Betaproteobacteria bacterium]|nr:gamma-glutamylcyclotransferase [Pseudomonadota bacterium]NBO11902.1 gamma-glutamylcyclotransferase [Betaproteobacteria bacterium]NBO43862.1 gamma-glutamylcyclotransferase [Betaproteobacteria bacterium]NBP09597.1 gamma-glutamylcyclotransferase [Betaproteobacteria bacterium]NBP61014.1 gamma-glutamylcyclotransferase [Betaproteobacteria bacterium]